jgi:hypothetical protein
MVSIAGGAKGASGKEGPERSGLLQWQGRGCKSLSRWSRWNYGGAEI